MPLFFFPSPVETSAAKVVNKKNHLALFIMTPERHRAILRAAEKPRAN
jgi:hypothetical protein